MGSRETKKRMIIKGGRVHGVGYRPFLIGIAESLEIGRFSADNLYVDGTEAVEVLVEDEGGKVKAFLDMAMKRRPEGADVEKIDVADYDGAVMRTGSYYRYLTSMQLSKMAEYGSRMIEKQDETIEKQDETIEGVKGLKDEFRDYREEFRDYGEEFRGFSDRTDGNFRLMSERYGEISEKLSLTLEVLRAESAETRRMLAEAIESLKRDSAETRAELKRSVDALVRVVEKFIGRL